MIVGYARVSTKGQDRNGNSLQDQERQLLERGCDKIYKDSYTGTKMDRPAFGQLLNELKRGDTLVVTKLDRFARTTAGGIETIKGLLDRGVSVHVLNMGLIDNTATGQLIITVLLAFAEFERNMIVERTSAGKAVARESKPNWREGRKRKDVSSNDVAEFREKCKKGELTVDECCSQLGISRSTWYSRIRESA